MRKDFTIEEGSGNVFADIGLPNAKERIIKAEAIRLARETADRRKALDELARQAQELKLGYED